MTRAACLVLLVALAGCGGPDDRGGGPGSGSGNGGDSTTVSETAPESGTPAPATRAIHFTNVTADSGLGEFSLTSGTASPTQILEVKGGGIALIDFDGDGDMDLFVPNGATLAAPHAGPGCRLFENSTIPGGDFVFRDVTEGSGLDFNGWGMGAAVGDLNGDGHQDLVITAYGPNALHFGRGDGTFSVGGGGRDTGLERASWSTGAALGDLDLDGDLDLVIVNYLTFDATNPPGPSSFRGIPVLAGPKGMAAQADAVFMNDGNGGFRDVTADWNFVAAPAFGLGAVIVDFDRDGDLDVYVGNDSMPSALYVNLGPDDSGGFLGFEERGAAVGIATNRDGSPQATMGLAVNDVNGDGWPDLFSTNFASDTNTMHVSDAGRFYDDATKRYGLGMVSYQALSWACAFVDFDHDRDEDLVVFNGHVYPQASLESMNSPYRQKPLLFVREGPRFRVQRDGAGAWLAAEHVDRSAVFGDLDRDGDIDMIVAERGGPLRVLRNDCAGGHWLIVAPDRPWGCRVEIESAAGTMTRWITSGAGFLSVSEPAAHFGLGSDAAPVTVRVIWPGSDRVRELQGVPVDQRLTVTES